MVIKYRQTTEIWSRSNVSQSKERKTAKIKENKTEQRYCKVEKRIRAACIKEGNKHQTMKVFGKITENKIPPTTSRLMVELLLLKLTIQYEKVTEVSQFEDNNSIQKLKNLKAKSNKKLTCLFDSLYSDHELLWYAYDLAITANFLLISRKRNGAA